MHALVRLFRWLVAVPIACAGLILFCVYCAVAGLVMLAMVLVAWRS